MTRKTPARLDGLALLTVAIALITVAVLAPGIAHSSSSRVIVHRTDVQVRATQACERNTDRDRAATPTRRLYSSSQSVPFRHWAYRLWKDRAAHACAKVRYLNAVPPRAIKYVFDRIGQSSTALTVAGREAGSGDIWKHPYCTGATNGSHDGCFQFGSWAKSTFGFGLTALDQAWAALRYVVHDGSWCGGWQQTAPGC